jgi:hypothetical protein
MLSQLTRVGSSEGIAMTEHKPMVRVYVCVSMCVCVCVCVCLCVCVCVCHKSGDVVMESP